MTFLKDGDVYHYYAEVANGKYLNLADYQLIQAGINNKDLVNTWFEKSDKLYNFFERCSDISDIDVEAEVCDLFSKIYVCKMIEDGKYKLEKVKS